MDYSLLKKVYNITSFLGCSEEDIETIRRIYGGIPKVLEEFYLQAWNTPELSVGNDFWLTPEYCRKYTWMKEEKYKDYYILLCENQGVYMAVIKKRDMTKENPPVYIIDDSLEMVGMASGTTDEFLMGMLLYEAIFNMEYALEDFVWYTDEEVENIEKSLKKYPYEIRNWYSDILCVYTVTDDNLLFIMKGEDNQGTYGASVLTR